MGNKLIELLSELTKAMEKQLDSDQQRWGDTWKYRDRQGQEKRIFSRFRDYYDQWEKGGQPIPWLKIACLAHIAMVRENHPELLIEPDSPEEG